ncbi:MAG: D-cysteine desulfhydrase family protein [Rhodobacteraceae bacterium]|nr:D-cysteine desulfhydrase family protein [Paracoccaceae bacterium]
MTDVFEVLDRFPRAKLISGPTPLERLHRLSTHLDIDLWIKRDDLTGLGAGGNKIRQLEFYFGDALAKGADTILITGAVQSNYVRAAAAVAAKLGLESVLQLESRVPNMGTLYQSSGNVFLSQLLGAEHIYFAEGEDESGADAALHAKADVLRAAGKTPYVIPLGLNSKPLGALGYLRAAREILQQQADFDAVVVASGSGATHAGLLTGLRALGATMPVYGICVRRNAEQQTARLQTVLSKISKLLGNANVPNLGILTRDDALAPGYGQISERVKGALKMMAQYEGLFLDPVYTAKAFAGVLELLQGGEIQPGMRVLFIHTGGVPALFAYQEELD